MTSVAISKTDGRPEWVEQFFAEEQKRADAAGMNLIEYQMQVSDGLLKPTILKILRHNKAHPDTCPPDCAWQESIKRMRKEFGVKSSGV